MNNILLVEDDPTVLDMLCTYVKTKNDNPLPFKNGKEVLEFLEKNQSIKISLMITDYEMEPVNGLELVSKLNTNEYNFPKILLTSHHETHLMVKAIESQIFRFIEKPLKYSFLDPIYLEALNKNMLIDKDEDLKKLGEAYGTIVHEIANPLNSIIMYAELIKQTYDGTNKIDPAKLMSQLDTIQSSGFRIDNIIKDIKDFINSKPTKKENFTIKSLLPEILDGFKAIKYSSQVTLNTDEVSALSVNFDKGQLYRLIINLLSNAVDAISDKNEKWIKISTEEDFKFIKIRITDCGDGIPASVVNKIFAKGYSNKKACKGTGLGLDICRKILHAYDGTLNYELFNGNTSFVIYIPKS